MMQGAKRSTTLKVGTDRTGVLTFATILAFVFSTDARAADWEYTEVRDPCADATPLRRPYFGDLHIHTEFSADAYIFGTRGTPADAYAFAQGAPIAISDDFELQTRIVSIDRPLDFAAVTDHAEFFGEVDLCIDPLSPVYDDFLCTLLRRPEPNLVDRFEATVHWLLPLGSPNPPTEHAFCLTPGVDCDASASSVWQQMQADAEAVYDRSDACTFTTFVGYEYTASVAARHLHRNVIFRNANVPPIAHSYLDTFSEGLPQGLWTALEDECLDAGFGCDVMVIPHNSNLSGGLQFFDPLNAEDAEQRNKLEPLVEIHQVKGNSECRFDRIADAGIGTTDDLCVFEQRLDSDGAPAATPLPIDQYPARNMVRNVLKDGLAFQEIFGTNPFEFGFIASTDSHNANPGDTGETSWPGAGGNEDSSPARRIDNVIRENPGGLAVVWAEENSRDALFSGLRRRESYATSGTRPVVRFFAGDLSGVTCGAPDFVETAYDTGVPMGGELAATCDGSVPSFAVWSLKDPGTIAIPGTDLQRVQIVKGWLDAYGEVHEAVIDVAGDADNGAGVDPLTCATTGAGASELCTVWQDPDFRAGEASFYYVRVIENPTCRWSTLLCKDAGVDPFAVDCEAQATLGGPEFADCCLDESNDPFLSPTIQERAWTSPVWYRPHDGVGVIGRVSFSGAGSDQFDLKLQLGAGFTLAPDASDIDISLSDDVAAYGLNVPAGTLVERRPGRFRYDPKTGSLPGVKKLKLKQRAGKTARFKMRVDGLDLQAFDPSDHTLNVQFAHAGYCPVVGRPWIARGNKLRTRHRSG